MKTVPPPGRTVAPARGVTGAIGAADCGGRGIAGRCGKAVLGRPVLICAVVTPDEACADATDGGAAPAGDAAIASASANPKRMNSSGG